VKERERGGGDKRKEMHDKREKLKRAKKEKDKKEQRKGIENEERKKTSRRVETVVVHRDDPAKQVDRY